MGICLKNDILDGKLPASSTQDKGNGAVGHHILAIDTVGMVEHTVKLVESYLARSQKNSILWLAFSGSSVSPREFWDGFVQLIQRWSPVLSKQLAQNGFPESPGAERRVVELVLEAAVIEAPVFVFKDYHLLVDGPVRKWLVSLMGSTCRMVSYILLCEVSPDLALPDGIKPMYIDSQQPLLSHQEIKAYYAALNIQMEEKQVDILYEITGGWPVFIYILGMHLHRNKLQTHLDTDNAVAFLFTVFDGEWYARLDENMQEMLILASLLDEIPVEFKLEGNTKSALEIKEFFRRFPYVQFHAATNSYRFQPLFRQYLNAKQLGVSTKVRYAFFRKVAEWYEQQGARREPMWYYLQCRDYDRMRRFLGRLDLQGLPDKERPELVGILDQVPSGILQKHPMMRFYRILLIHLGGGNKALRQEIEQLERDIQTSPLRETKEGSEALGELCLLLALDAMRRGVPDFVGLFRRGSELLPNGTKIWTGQTKSFISSTSCLALDPDCTLDQYVEAYQQAAPYMHIALGDYGRGVETLALCEAQTTRMETALADHSARKTLKIAVEYRQWDIACNACYISALNSIVQGSLEEVNYHRNACRMYAQIESQHDYHLLPDVADFVLYHYVGDLDAAASWIKSTTDGKLIAQYQTAGRELYYIALYMVDRGQLYQALSYIETAMGVCRRNHKWYPELNLQVLKALVYSMLGQSLICAKNLQSSYERTNPDGVISPYVVAGDTMRSAIRQIRELPPDAHSIPSEWLEKIDQQAYAFSKSVRKLKQEYYRLHPASLVGSFDLTKRESEAFSLLCLGLSNKIIAREMNIEENSVKSTLSRVYQKIGAQNRSDAVRIGLSMGLVDQDNGQHRTL